MANQSLYLYLLPDLTQVQWRLDTADQSLEGQCEIAQLTEQLPPLTQPKTWLWWPAQRAALQTVQLPMGQQRQLQRILPFAVEEYLATDLDSVHFVDSSKVMHNQVWVSIVDRQLFEQALEQLLAAPLQLMHIELDILALSRQSQDLASLWVFAEQSFLCHPQIRSSGLLNTQLMLLESLPLPETSNEQTPSLALHLSPSTPAAEETDQLAAQLDALGYQTRTLEQPQGLLNLLVANKAQTGSPGNLLSGPYSQNQHQGLWQRLPLSALASSMGVFLAIFLLWSLASGLQNNRQGQAYEQATEVLYREIFGDQARFVQARYRQDIENLLRQSGQGRASGFIPLMVLAAQNLPASDQIRIERLNYLDSRDELLLVLRTQDLNSLENARTAMQQAGIGVELSLVQDGQGSIGTFRITGGQ